MNANRVHEPRVHEPVRIARASPCGRIAAAVLVMQFIAGVAAVMAADPVSPGSPRAGIFGVEAEGRRVVYLLDRSASMGEADGAALRAAKREMRSSLEALSDVQQFHLVSYNHRPRAFSPSGSTGRPAFASEAARKEAATFIESIRADGGTDHVAAIRAAMRLGPDLMLLVTDGDEADDIAEAEFASLERYVAPAKLVVIQFAAAGAAGSPRLMELARRTGGDARSIDPRASR